PADRVLSVGIANQPQVSKRDPFRVLYAHAVVRIPNQPILEHASAGIMRPSKLAGAHQLIAHCETDMRGEGYVAFEGADRHVVDADAAMASRPGCILKIRSRELHSPKAVLDKRARKVEEPGVPAAGRNIVLDDRSTALEPEPVAFVAEVLNIL